MSIGIWQIVIIVGLVVLLFGAGRLPKIMADLAAGLKAFKHGLDDKKAPDVPSSSEKLLERSAQDDISMEHGLVVAPKKIGGKRTPSKKAGGTTPEKREKSKPQERKKTTQTAKANSRNKSGKGSGKKAKSSS